MKNETNPILFDESENHKKAERLYGVTQPTYIDLTYYFWRQINDYPTADLGIHHMAIVSHVNAYYVFGGALAKQDGLHTVHNPTRNVVRLDYKTSMWTVIGEAALARWGHRVIFNGNAFLVVGLVFLL